MLEVSLTPQTLCHMGKLPYTHQIGSLVDPRACLDTMEWRDKSRASVLLCTASFLGFFLTFKEHFYQSWNLIQSFYANNVSRLAK